jgi:hypothetical protein
MVTLRRGTPTSICCQTRETPRDARTFIYTVAKWLGDRVDVVEKSYGYLAPNTAEVNKVA